MTQVHKILSFTLIMLAAITPAVQAEDELVDNPLYKHWAQFKPGSYSVLRTYFDASGKVIQSRIRQTLLKVTPTEVIITKKPGMMREEQWVDMVEHKVKIPARITPEEAAKQEPENTAGEGEEELDIAGQKLQTHWVALDTLFARVQKNSKIWTSEEVPGRVVKEDTVTNPGTGVEAGVSSLVIEFKADKASSQRETSSP